jgi:O-antigen/teichoic acid export membrane protein
LLVLLGLFSGIVTARVLGPGKRGELSFLVLIPAILTVIGSLGAENGIYYFWHHNGGRFRANLLGTCAAVATVCGLFSGAISYAIISLIKPQTVLLLRLLVAASMPLAIANAMLTMALMASGRLGRYNASRLAGPIFYTGTVAILWVAHDLGVFTAFVGWFGSMVVTILADVALMIGLTTGKPRWSVLVARRSVSYGLRSCVGNVSQYGTLRLDQVMLGAFAGSESLGLYYAVVSIGEALMYLAINTGAAMMAQFGKRSTAERRHLALITMTLTVFLTAIAAVLLAMFGEIVIRLLFGRAYLPALPALRILLLGMVPLASAQVMSQYFIAIGKAAIFAHAALASLVVTIIGDVLLIPRFRADGAALASVLAYLVLALWMAFKFRAYHSTHSKTVAIDHFQDGIAA